MLKEMDKIFTDFTEKLSGLEKQADVLALKSSIIGKKGSLAEILKSLKDADFLLYCSPVKAGFITSQTKKALDRFIPNVLPLISIYDNESHHLVRYPDKPKVLGVVLMDDGNISDSSSDFIFRNFDRVQKNMRSRKSLRFKLTKENREELLDEIISY